MVPAQGVLVRDESNTAIEKDGLAEREMEFSQSPAAQFPTEVGTPPPSTSDVAAAPIGLMYF
jgi:hypothetical protein